MTTTRTKINLPKVEPFFPTEMAESGRRVDKVLAQLAHDASVINADGAASLAAHLADHGNPHVVTKAQVGLALVENTALSTWAGSTNLTTLGTVATGTWNATAIAWAKVDKTGSSLADLTTRSAGDLSSGNLAYARLPTGSNSWDTGVGTTITITRSLTVSGTLAGTLTGNASTATALQNARTIGGVSFDGTANITVATATGGFTVSGGALALGANNLTMTGSLGATGARLTKGWFTDLQVTNAIAGSVTGSAATWTTARNLAGNSVDGSANVAFANKFIVQGTADAGLSAAQFLGALGTGIVKNTTTTGVLSIAVAGDFPTLNQNTTGSAATLTTTRTIWGQNFNGSANVSGALSGATTGVFSSTVSAAVVNVGTITNATGDYLYVGSDVTTGLVCDVAGGPPLMEFRRSGGTQASRSNAAGSDTAGLMRFKVWSGATGFWNTSQIECRVTSLANNQLPGTALRFSTSTNSGAVTENFRINDNGFIGIVSGNHFALDGVATTGDTYILESSANVMDFFAGGVNTLRLSATALTFAKPAILKGYTVATLPTGVVGMVAYATDLLAPAFLVAAAGGGAVTGPVFYDGANWVAI